MSILKTVLSKFKYIVNWGTNNLVSSSEIKRVKAINYSLIVGIFSLLTFNISYIIVDFKLLLPVIINYDLFLPILFIGLYVNKKGFHLYAKLLFNLSIFLPTFILTAILSGNDPGIHFYFLLFALLPFLYWSLKDVAFTLFFLFINLASFVYVEFFTIPENLFVIFPESSILFYRIISLTFSFLSIALLLIIYQYQSEKNENLLHQNSEFLKDTNERLLQKTDKILLQRNQIEDQKNKLEQANNTKDKFFSIIAHDLKSPFNALLGFSELLLLKNSEYDESEKEKMIKLIYDTSNQTLTLLNNLLLWSKIETGQVHFDPQKLMISKIINDVVLLSGNIASKKNIEIKFENRVDYEVYADKEMIATVVRNLISNAIKFSNKDSFINIKLNKESDTLVKVSIEDNGIGIEQTMLQEINSFENFSTSKGTDGEKGSGLGLKLCKEFVEKNDGEIMIQSKKDKGSTFSFTLPINSA